MRKKIACFFLLFVLMLLLVACGGSGQEENTYGQDISALQEEVSQLETRIEALENSANAAAEQDVGEPQSSGDAATDFDATLLINSWVRDVPGTNVFQQFTFGEGNYVEYCSGAYEGGIDGPSTGTYTLDGNTMTLNMERILPGDLLVKQSAVAEVALNGEQLVLTFISSESSENDFKPLWEPGETATFDKGSIV